MLLVGFWLDCGLVEVGLFEEIVPPDEICPVLLELGGLKVLSQVSSTPSLSASIPLLTAPGQESLASSIPSPSLSRSSSGIYIG